MTWVYQGLQNPIFLVLSVIAYLLGSVNGAILICRLFRLPDPRTQGSKNPGATNVMRIAREKYGKTPALFTFLFDALKAMPMVLIAHYLGMHDTFLLSLIGLFAVVGHLFPIWYRFIGGKGIATTFGFLLVLSPILFAITGLSWLVIFALSRISAVAGLITFAAVVPIASYVLLPAIFPTTLILAVLIVMRHKQNIFDLWFTHQS